MTQSYFEGMVRDIESKLSDATVRFYIGKEGLSTNAQRRRIVFIRQSEEISYQSYPRHPDGSIAQFQREATVEVHIFAEKTPLSTLLAADEDAAGETDLLIDQFLDSAHRALAANWTPGSGQWENNDSAAEGYGKRCPHFIFTFTVKFPVRKTIPVLYPILSATGGGHFATGTLNHGYTATGPVGP